MARKQALQCAVQACLIRKSDLCPAFGLGSKTVAGPFWETAILPKIKT